MYLQAAIHSNHIECMLGSYRSHITHRCVIKLVGSSVSAQVIVAPVGGLKRKALEAAERIQRPLKKRFIDFGCQVPFTRIPAFVEKGFEEIDNIFSRENSNNKVREHYQFARICLQGSLDIDLCDLLLMLVLTVSSSSVTPEVSQVGKGYQKATKQRDMAQFAAAISVVVVLRPSDSKIEAVTVQVLTISHQNRP